MTGLSGHRALVVGLGHRTGLAACNFLAKRGFQVTGNDIRSAGELAAVLKKVDASVKIIAGEQSPEILNGGFDFLVLSPGVPKSIALVRRAGEMKIPVISEIELAYRFMKGLIVGVTGTDGKSTTVTLTGHLLKGLGINTFVGGNIGIPLVSLVEGMDDDSVSVVELSSYQLETIDLFRADAAAILNITPDHLDRYAGLDEYGRAKLRIAENQADNDAFIYYYDDEHINHLLQEVRSKKLSFSLENTSADAFLKDGYIVLRRGGKTVNVLDISTLRILGSHNVLNTMASLLMVLSILERRGMEPDYRRLAELAAEFRGLPHRMEKIGDYAGRTFINDSKATTVGAVEMALAGFNGNAVLILGGRTKGDDYSRLAGGMAGKVRTLVLLGESKHEFARIFNGFKPTVVDTLEEAVVASMKLSEEGDSILLSPACASFDMFESYEDRGNRFRECFDKLTGGEISWT